MDDIDHNRLLLEMEKAISEINRAVINPQIPELKLADLSLFIEMVARTRAAYLKDLFDLAAEVGEGLPTREQVKQLSEMRETYEELVMGAHALETAIERGYLDVQR